MKTLIILKSLLLDSFLLSPKKMPAHAYSYTNIKRLLSKDPRQGCYVNKKKMRISMMKLSAYYHISNSSSIFIKTEYGHQSN